MNDLKEKYSKEVSESCFKLDTNIEKQTNLEIELLKTKSKMDESYLQINELKKTVTSQKNLIDLLKRNYNEKEIQFNELQDLYDKCLNDNKQLLQLNSNEKYQLQLKYHDLQSKVKI